MYPDNVVSAARAWIGTPYHHQASLCGVGADCLGLVRGVYRELVGPEPFVIPPYSPRLGDADGAEHLLTAAREFLREVTRPFAPGDVLIFRVNFAISAKHCAICTGHDRMVHALANMGVRETGVASWATRIAGVFEFPGVV